jgi:hypothetical protein
MNLFADFVGGVVRGVIKVALLLLTAIFILGVLCVGLVVVLVAVIRYLLTGRKPAVVTTFSRFNQAAQQFRPGGWQRQGPGATTHASDIVDVQAHEVRAPAGGALPPKSND